MIDWWKRWYRAWTTIGVAHYLSNTFIPRERVERAWRERRTRSTRLAK